MSRRVGRITRQERSSFIDFRPLSIFYETHRRHDPFLTSSLPNLSILLPRNLLSFPDNLICLLTRQSLCLRTVEDTYTAISPSLITTDSSRSYPYRTIWSSRATDNRRFPPARVPLIA